MLTALEVFNQQDGNVTRSYYEHLERLGPQGHIACCLFRAQKRSSRAKQYSRGRYRGAAYDVKQWSIQQLCAALEKEGACLGIARWGWKPDSSVILDGGASWVLYVELPQGQVSFHSPSREGGPDYSGSWDGVRNASAGRIIQFCDSLSRSAPTAPGVDEADDDLPFMDYSREDAILRDEEEVEAELALNERHSGVSFEQGGKRTASAGKEEKGVDS